MSKTTVARALASVLAASSMLAACSGGPSESEFVKACLASSQAQAVDAKMCSCMAHEAKSTLSPKFYQAMVLDMQGKKQEEEALLGDMPFDQRAAFGMKQIEVLGKCLHHE